MVTEVQILVLAASRLVVYTQTQPNTYLIGLCVVHVEIHYVLSPEAHEIMKDLTWRNDVSLYSPLGPEASHCMCSQFTAVNKGYSSNSTRLGERSRVSEDKNALHVPGHDI